MLERALLLSCLCVPCALPLAAACGDAPPPAAPAELVLHARLEFDTGEARAVGLTSFDLDGDGRDELISLVSGPGAIHVWSGVSNHAGARVPDVAFPVGDFALGPVRVGAWKPGKGGGPAVVAIAQREEPAVVWIDVRALFLGRGDPLVARVALESRPRALASGDIGLDGVPEVAVATLDDELLVLRGGEVLERTKLADEQTTCLWITDDGESILAGSQASRRITRYVSPSASLPRAPSASVQLEGLPRRIDEIADWRETKASRFLVASGDEDVVWLTPGLRIERTERVAAVPIDLVHTGVAPRRARLTVSVHGQQAAIEFEDGTSSAAYAGQHPTAGALGDFDGDGRLDVALANGDAKRISVMFARPEGGWDLARFTPTGRSPHSIDVGDFDGDGRLDVVALCAKDSTIQVHRGTETGLSTGISQGFAENASRITARDLDGDGHLDVAFLRESIEGMLLDAWFGDGTGHLWMRGETKPVACASSPGSLMIADLESDGRLSAVVTDPRGSRISVVPIERSTAAGKDAGGSIRFGAPRAFDVAGAPDALALIANAKGGSVVAVALTASAPRGGWIMCRMTREACAENFHQPMSERARALAADAQTGMLAYVGGTDAASTLSVFSRDTAGGQGPGLRGTWAAGLRAFAVRCADLDGDGHGDVVISAQNSHHLNLWLGADPATGTALARMPDIGVGTGPLDVVLADLDGDGALEIVAACAFSDEIAVVKLR